MNSFLAAAHVRKILLATLILFEFSHAFSQTRMQAVNVLDQYSEVRLTTMASKFKRESISEKKKAIALAKQKGWLISEKLENNNFTELQRIGPDGTPIYYITLNNMVRTTTRVQNMQDTRMVDFDLEGQGMKIGVWDGGVAMATHREFDNRLSHGSGNTNVNGHATHVAGILMAKGKSDEARGIVPKAKALSYNWYLDKNEVIAEAANGMLVSNHSYGINAKAVPDWYFGAYIYQAKDWDEIMYNAPYYLAVIAAGNSQTDIYNDSPMFSDTEFNYDSLVGFALSKNGITVGATQKTDIGTDGTLIDASIASFSSFGPSDEGRIKPDLVGHGVGIYSAFNGANDSYNYITGTSAAAPSVSGVLLLLQEYYEKKEGAFMKAATLKGLALHTADDIEDDGPDGKSGWGFINAKSAIETIKYNAVKSTIKELTLNAGESYSLTVTAEEAANLMASISWTDLPGNAVINTLNSTSAALVHDLDIRVTQDETVYKPWKLVVNHLSRGAVKGDNSVDPFEKIEIKNASGTYTITVSHKGELTTERQNFSLILTGIDMGIAAYEAEHGLINNEYQVKELSVFPNPSTDIIYINNNNLDRASYTIINATGKIVITGNLQRDTGIDVSKLTTGMYILKLDNGNGSSTKKFYKN